MEGKDSYNSSHLNLKGSSSKSEETKISIFGKNFNPNTNIYGIATPLYELTIVNKPIDFTEILQKMFEAFEGRIVGADLTYINLSDILWDYDNNDSEEEKPQQPTLIFNPQAKCEFANTEPKAEFIDTLFTNSIIQNIFIENVSFNNCYFGSVNMYNVKFINCKFYQCHFSKAIFEYTEFYNCYIDSGCNFMSNHFNHCVFDLYRNYDKTVGSESYQSNTTQLSVNEWHNNTFIDSYIILPKQNKEVEWTDDAQKVPLSSYIK